MSLAAVRRRGDKNGSLTEFLPMRRDVVLYSNVFLGKVGQMMCVDLERSQFDSTTIDERLITCRKTFVIHCLLGYENEFIWLACIGWSGIH